MKSKLIGIVTAVIGISLAAAACNSSLTSAASSGASHSAIAAPAAAPKGKFGTECAKVPATGMGSFSGMAGAPVVTAASHNPLLSDFVRAIHAAGLTSALNSAKAITVFAPDNDAFAAIGSGNLQTLMDSRADLRKVLEYHVVNGRVTSADLATGAALTSLQGTNVQPLRTGDVYTINNAEVVCGNVQTANATVYIINKVLIP
jgi:uncharacterized surface protein with fasciclin (FAS1) repeats